MKYAYISFAAIVALTLMPVSALAAVCKIDQTPVVDIELKSEEILYDFDRSAAELNAMRGVGVDATTGGLRKDNQSVALSHLSWMFQEHQRAKTGCLAFDRIVVTIQLRPEIYIAREYTTGQCRDEILRHEQRHVEVDRIVVNKYARLIGEAVQGAVDRTGVLGPFPIQNLQAEKDRTSHLIQETIRQQTQAMQREMRVRQAEVDTLEEYERVSRICGELIGALRLNRRR